MAIETGRIAVGLRPKFKALAKRHAIKNPETIIEAVQVALRAWPELATRNQVGAEKIDRVHAMIKTAAI